MFEARRRTGGLRCFDLGWSTSVTRVPDRATTRRPRLWTDSRTGACRLLAPRTADMANSVECAVLFRDEELRCFDQTTRKNGVNRLGHGPVAGGRTSTREFEEHGRPNVTERNAPAQRGTNRREAR